MTVTILVYSSEITEYEYCLDKTNIININSTIKPPVNIYLKYSDYYQNYRTYSKSLSIPQLQGNSDSNLNTDCTPIVKLKDLEYNSTFFNYQHTLILNNTLNANPCGLIAASFIDYNITIQQTYPLDINADTIAWETYDIIEYKNNGLLQYRNKEDNHFKVWMRAGATKDFLKFYGVVSEPMAGEYEVKITQGANYLNTRSSPCLVFSNANILGGTNYFIGYIMLVCSVLSLLWVAALCFVSKSYMPPTLEAVFNINST